MHISIFGLITAASAVVGECYLGGVNMPNQDVVRAQAHDVCDKNFSKVVYNDQTKEAYACYNVDDHTMITFAVKRISAGGDMQISPADCYDGLRKEIGGCQHGGHSNYTNWLFMLCGPERRPV
ncbi:hypothetical protein SLS62_005083 [Diatrype stigma]|uniref:Uncharacterized protein n=1 Tax=Diatrype stigma TaxID=117547 RepID=A0AAN9V1S3_9PEZI